MKTPDNKYDEDGLQQQLMDIVRQLSNNPNESSSRRYKSLPDIVLIIFNIALSSFYFGYSMVYLPAIDFGLIYKLYSIPITYEVAQGILVACVAIGGGMGALSSSFLVARFSRRNSLLIVNALAIVAGLLLYVQNFQFFVFARLFQGFCTGLLSSIAPLMMKQLSPNEISGTLTSFHQIFITFGATFGFLFSMMLSFIMSDSTGEKKWQIVFGFSLIIVAAQSWVLIFKYNFETPKYLLQNNRQEQARELIERIYKPEYVDEVLKEMKANFTHDKQTTNTQQGIEMVDRNMENFKEQNKNKKQSSGHGETPRSAAIAAIHLAVLQQMCGVNAVVAYGGQIVGERQPSLKMAMPIIINALQFGGAIITAYLLTKIGRRFLLEYGALTTAIGAIIVAIGFMNNSLSWILFGLIFFMACFGLTLGPVVWIYLPEVSQPKVLSLATGASWASCSLVMLLFPIIKKALPGQNPAFLFLFFAAWGFVSFFINRKYILETRNKGQKQIFQEYSSLKSFC